MPDLRAVSKPDEFETWLNERSKWLQTAAKKLIDSKKTPSEVEISELARLCKQEAMKQSDSGFETIIPGSLALASNRPALRIEGLSDVFGVNAIKAGAVLPFGPEQLTVIYGQNGSGKSGYARLIKQMCGSRSKDDIHPNVFLEAPLPCSAKLQISMDGVTQDIDWVLSGNTPNILRYVQVFDSKTATMYMNKNEASYEPSKMRFVSALIQISDQVSQKLNAEKTLLIKSLPKPPIELSTTDEIRWLSNLKPSTPHATIEKNCHYDQKLDEERVTIEGLLAQKDIQGRLNSINKEKQALANTLSSMTTLKQQLSNETIQTLIDTRIEATTKRKSAQEAAQAVFSSTPLSGIGETTWQKLWEQARLYSQTHAYPEQSFPVVSIGAKCVLCQQDLNTNTSERLKQFENFVTAGLEKEAKSAEEKLDNLLKQLPLLPSPQDWLARTSSFKAEQEGSLQWLNLLIERQKNITSANKLEEVTPFDWSPIETAIASISTQLSNEEKSLNLLLQDGKRQELETCLLKLRALQWLAQNKAAIISEHERLAAYEKLEKAVRLTSTNSLTTKKNELAKSELDAGYQRRFAEELKKLGGTRLPVTPQSKPQGKGKITFGLTLVGAHGNRTPDQILSEGETRIVALAAFLADITGSNQIAPFVFDDPISSLDQDFEERVVSRLVELAQTRQVIVFTHRLSLVSLVDAAIKKNSDNSNNSGVTHKIQTLRRLDKAAGILATQSARDTKPDKAVNKLLNEALPQLRKQQIQGDADAYDFAAKSVCSDFRIIVERTVETILINEIVMRFRREINTKGKLRKLIGITTEDCELIDDLMTRYSVFEHSQSDELPNTPPELIDLENDIKSLADWIKSFKERAA